MGGAPMCVRKALCKPRLALSETKLALLPGSAAHPVQNSPCRPARRPTRYKTLPARPKTPILGHLAPAGRTLYRFRHQQPKQGELYPACGAASGTKLSPLMASAGDTGRKLSQHTSSYRNSAKKFAQHNPSTSVFAKKFAQQAIKRHFWVIYRALGELFRVHARTGPSRANNFARQHPTTPQQRTPLQISHAIRLRELSTKPRNVAIPTIRIQSLKYPKGNCMRNYRADGAGRGARPRGRRAATGASQAKLAHNFPRSLLETTHKRCNCNDANSWFEVAARELRAKLLGGER